MSANMIDPNRECSGTTLNARVRSLFSLCVALAACLCVWAADVAPVAAQVKAPGRHPHYNVELEPHLVWQWNGDEIARSDGIGMGFRASIPILQDGPVPTINNSLAITFGFDWAHFPECYDYRYCSEDDFWVPVAVQWNFYLTPRFSLFPEFGLGFRDAVLDYDYDEPCRGRGCRGYSLEVHPVLWFGARFTLTDYIALVFRLGTPSLQLGVSFLI